ncbi:MAG: SdpI family protein [Candidatus Diapherotrites archaeon]|jgi:uncharacterized membrane protein|uniref:SdpI family protein n=1 Tax=Candidatus Iainarchaeum sp. TaxID=3101447 RepID=A0A8T5GGG6_9ARCH|nr:SdpI family protein [Candidatus Diapherotrites archaeon]
MDFDKTKFLLVVALLILILIAMSFAVYNKVPQNIATHWNIEGNADSYMPKEIGLFLVPIFGIIISAVLLVVPMIDPLRKNIQEFIRYYNLFVLVMLGFLLYIHAITIIANLGYEFNMGQLISPAIGVIFFFAGILVGHTKKNYMIGIRTPWTLASEAVWDKTHDKGRTALKISGIICFFGLIIPKFAFWFILIPVIASVAYLFVYSYLEYKSEEKTKK